MTESPNHILAQMAEAVAGNYHRLVLVVGPTRSGKTERLRTLKQPIVNVNLAMSAAMLDLPQRRRSLEAPRLLSNLITSVPTSPVVLDNLEMLFDSTLKLDPIACLKQASRNRTIIASIPGVIDDGQLIYAEPSHAEYRRFPTDDLLIDDLSVLTTA
jgi:predicted AAA+ superfamily ATPase